jgi:hypothetical protein
LALLRSPNFIRCVGSERGGDERSQCGEQMVAETLGGARLIESSYELEHAIEVGPRVAVHKNPRLRELSARLPHTSNDVLPKFCSFGSLLSYDT